MNMKQRALLGSLIGHGLLFLAILMDYLKRGHEGEWSAYFSALGGIALVCGGLLFVRQPKWFFFQTKVREESLVEPTLIQRLLAWTFTLTVPVAWLLLILETDLESFGIRILVAYAFFAWIAVSILISRYLFSSR